MFYKLVTDAVHYNVFLILFILSVYDFHLDICIIIIIIISEKVKKCWFQLLRTEKNYYLGQLNKNIGLGNQLLKTDNSFFLIGSLYFRSNAQPLFISGKNPMKMVAYPIPNLYMLDQKTIVSFVFKNFMRTKFHFRNMFLLSWNFFLYISHFLQ